MKLTNVLRAQHLGWYFKKHWKIQGKRIPTDTGAKAVLEELNKQVVDAEEIAFNTLKDVRLPALQKSNIEEVTKAVPKVISFDDRPKCFVYQDKHVLLEGLVQTEILTNTVEINSMPKRLELTEKSAIPNVVDKNIQDAILSSFVYDTEQEKLAKVKIPERPAFNLPRIYGITDDRKSLLTISKLLFECEKLGGKTETGKRRIINNVNFTASVSRENSKVQFNIPVQVFVTSNRPIEPFREKYNTELPDMFPLKCTISIPREEELQTWNFYPLQKEMLYSHPHTVITFYSPSKVKNLSEEPVTPAQRNARTLISAFTTAAARAQQLFGDVKTIPKPIVVQSIQTDGRTFHFGIFQLNTLDLDNTDGIRNYWFQLPNVHLFEECTYFKGRPILRGYNKSVIKYLRSFYMNN